VQLLSLARAIVMNPQVLLLDEPTSGIDAGTEAAVFAAIRQVSQGRTILSISHRLSGVIDADRVHILARGRIVESGTSDELAGRGGWYAVYKRMEDAGWQFSEGAAL
jgi:ATP-binding cassette subfamily B multidrug efflux pump